MRKGLSPAVAFGGLVFMVVMPVAYFLNNGDVSGATIPNTPAYRLCTHLDFFQLTPSIKLGAGSQAVRRKLSSCVDVDEEFWRKIKEADVFPVRGSRSDRERDVLGLIIFLSANIRGVSQGALLHVDTAPGGDYVLNIMRRPSTGEEGR